MGTFGIFGIIADKLITHTKDTARVKSLRKEDVRTIINQNIKMHNDLKFSLSVMSDSDMHTWMSNTVRPGLNESVDKLRDSYDNFCKKLTGSAISDERKCPLKSLAKANGKYVEILTKIDAKLDDFIDKEKIDLYETRMSQLAILGLLRDSNLIVNYTMYLYSYLVRVAKGDVNSIPGYRQQYILDNTDKAASIVSKILDKRGAYAFLNDVDRIRRQNADLILGANGKFNFHILANRGFYTPDFIDTLLGALACLNLYDAAANFIDDYKIDRNNRNKETREWLNNHVALLRLDLAETDPSSKEYTKLVNIIKAYDEKIAEYDEEINHFENEE